MPRTPTIIITVTHDIVAAETGMVFLTPRAARDVAARVERLPRKDEYSTKKREASCLTKNSVNRVSMSEQRRTREVLPLPSRAFSIPIDVIDDERQTSKQVQINE